MIRIDKALTPKALLPKLDRFWKVSAEKIRHIRDHYDHAQGSPVFTRKGAYTTRGWTEWTQGFEFGSAILQFEAAGDEEFLDYGRRMTLEKMAPHVSHVGVHDHGFNNVSTYGNLLRLMREGRIVQNDWEQHFYELALKISGAVQAHRWTSLPDDRGFIYSFNGPHSLFVDTIRSCRSLMVSHLLGHAFMAEGDRRISLLKRAIRHGQATATYAVYYGKGRDAYDIRGRTAHESIFNLNDGAYRCPNSQQGYTGFSTWTRGLAWAMCGFAEELELLAKLSDETLSEAGEPAEIRTTFLDAARATCDFYLAHTPTDGVPYWDTGAPGLVHLGDYLDRPADPFNDHEPVDSSAAAIAAQGLLRLGHHLGGNEEEEEEGRPYWQAGLAVLDRLLGDPYLSEKPEHQGLLLHSIYHRPNGWDEVPEGSAIPRGESSMWGDYHLREAALLVHRLAHGAGYHHFFDCADLGTL